MPELHEPPNVVFGPNPLTTSARPRNRTWRWDSCDVGPGRCRLAKCFRIHGAATQRACVPLPGVQGSHLLSILLTLTSFPRSKHKLGDRWSSCTMTL